MTTKSDIEQLFRSNYTAMLTLAIRLLHDTDTARDIVHDVFESVLSENMSAVTPAYLLTGVRFASLKHLRSLSLRERFNNLYALDLDEIEDDEWPGGCGAAERADRTVVDRAGQTGSEDALQRADVLRRDRRSIRYQRGGCL
mgnify:CR=1 FL=1